MSISNWLFYSLHLLCVHTVILSNMPERSRLLIIWRLYSHWQQKICLSLSTNHFHMILDKKKKAHANSFNSYFTVGLCVLDTIFALFNFIGLFTDTEEQRVRIWTLCLGQCHRCEGRSAPYGNNWSLSKLDKGHWAAANILKLTWPPQTHLRPMGTKSNRPLSNYRILLENPHLDVSKAELNFVNGVPNVVG